jgi:hypothetical protein
MKIWKVVRDTITGRFVKREEAEKRPETTVTETMGDGSYAGQQHT